MAAVVAAMRARFGADVDVFEHGPVTSAARITQAPAGLKVVKLDMPRRGSHTGAVLPEAAAATAPTRLQDAQPYFGGDRIVRTYVQNGVNYIVQCTANSAILLNSNNSQAMLTAGHCGPTGAVWDQGYYPGTGSTIYITGTMGTDQNTQWGNNRVDGEYLTGATYGYDPYVYTSLTGSVPIDGSAVTGTGSVFCTDGSFTGYSCGATVTHYNVCANVSEGSVVYDVCHLDIADANHLIGQSGDSGGPVLYPNSDGQGDDAVAGVISAQANNGDEVYFGDIDYEESALSMYVW